MSNLTNKYKLRMIYNIIKQTGRPQFIEDNKGGNQYKGGSCYNISPDGKLIIMNYNIDGYLVGITEVPQENY